MIDCKDCKHFKLASECEGWNTGPKDYRHGQCMVKMGERVEHEVRGDGYLGEVTVDAVFGCKAGAGND